MTPPVRPNASGESPEAREPGQQLAKGNGPGTDGSGAGVAPVTEGALAPGPAEVKNIISKLPPDQRAILEQSFSMMVSGPVMNPMLSKIDGQHLHKILDGAENESQRDHEDRDKDRSHNRFLAVLGLVGFLAIAALFLFMKQQELLKGVLVGFAVFLGGLGFGSKFTKKNDDD